MLRFLRRVVRRAPLLTLILIIWLVLTVLAFVGRKGAYKEYSTEHGRLPGLSIVMRGLHDHVYPWSGDGESAASGGSGEAADEESEKAESAAGPEGASGSGADQGKNTEEGAEIDGTQAENDGNSDAAQADSEAEVQKPQAEPLKVPDACCSKVVPAKDYGVADETYLSSDDTVYNTDKEGLFAPNGTYYSLQEVDDSYFADALMIGDSRTVGLYEYGDMANVTSFLARESASIYDLFDDEKLDYVPKGKETTQRTLKDLLAKTKFKKIYISVGVNELGVPDTEDYYEEFRKVVTKINKLQPDAIIYIQGIMHVSKNMSSTDRVYNNRAIVQRNKAISTLANGRNIFYIDMNGDLCDENGDLKVELTGDGIHLKATACELWHKFLRKNAIVLPGAAAAPAAPAEQTSEEKAAAQQAPAEETSEQQKTEQTAADQEAAQ